MARNTEYRRYRSMGNNKPILIGWIQRTCKLCSRFLGKHQIELCDKCKKEIKYTKKDYMRNYMKTKYHKENPGAKYNTIKQKGDDIIV